MTRADIERIFTYHKPTEEMQPKFLAIRNAGMELALAIHEHVPSSADQSAAIRKVREAVMTANAGIILDL